jgi:hypothetical protein
MNKPNMTRGVMIMVSFIFVAISVAIVVMFARLNDRVNDLEDQLKVESNTRNSSHDTLASQLAKLVTSGELLNAKVDENIEDNEATDKAQSFRIRETEASDDLINDRITTVGDALKEKLQEVLLEVDKNAVENNATDEAQSFRILETEASDDLINDRITTVGDALKEKLQEVLLEVGKNAADYATDQQSINETLVEHTQYIANNAADTSTNADKIVTNTQGVSANAELIAENAEAIVNAVAPPLFESSSTADILEGNYAEVPFHEGTFSDPEEVVSFNILSSTLEQNNVTGVLADGILQLFASEPLVRDETFSVTVDATDANGNRSDPFMVEFHVRPVPVFDPAEQSVAIPQGTEPGYDLVFAQCDVPFDQVTYSISQFYGTHQGLFQVTQPDSDSAPVIVTTQNTLDIATANVYSFYLDANTEFDAVGRFRVNVDTLVPIFTSSDSVDILQTHDLSGKIYTARFNESVVEVSEISIDSSTRNDITATSVDGVFELYATESFERGEEFSVGIIAKGVNGNWSEPLTVEFRVQTVPLFDPDSQTFIIPTNTEVGHVLTLDQCDVGLSDVTYSVSMLTDGMEGYYEVTQPASESDNVVLTTLQTMGDESATQYSFQLVATTSSFGAQGQFDATVDTRVPVFSSSESADPLETHDISTPIYTAQFSTSPDNVTDFGVLSTTPTKNIIASSTEGRFELFVEEQLNRDEVFSVELVATDIHSGIRSDPFVVEFTVRTVPVFDPVSKTFVIPRRTGAGHRIELDQSDVHFDEVVYSLEQSDGANPNRYYELTQPDAEASYVVVTTLEELRDSTTTEYNFRLLATTTLGDQGVFDVFIDTTQS